jgi:hypothetical protein
MGNVESQIAMSLQGLMAGQRQANVNVSGAGGGGVDPRVLQQMLQMQEAEAMGLTKEQERMQKEQMRHENRATLGVLLEDTLAQKRQEQAFQREVELQNQRIAEQNRFQDEANRYNHEAALFNTRNEKDKAAEQARMAKAAEARSLDMTRQIVASQVSVENRQNYLASGIGLGADIVSKSYEQMFNLNQRVDGALTALNTGFAGRNFKSYVAPEDGRAKISKGAKIHDAARQYSTEVANIALGVDPEYNSSTPSGQRRARELQRRVEDMLIAAGDKDMSAEERRDMFEANLQQIGAIAGPHGKAVVRRSIRKMAKLTTTTQVVDEKTGATRTPEFKDSEVGTMFETASSLFGVKLGDDEFDLIEPSELFRETFLTAMHVISAPDPRTGELMPLEERQAGLRKLSREMTNKFAQTFKIPSEEAEELAGYLEAGLISTMAVDEQMQAHEALVREAQVSEEGRAVLEALEIRGGELGRMEQFVSSFLEDHFKKGQADAGTGVDAATGAGEKAPRPQSAGARDAAQP